MKKTVAILALVAAAGVAQASIVVPGTLIASTSFNGKHSIDAQGDIDNNTGSAVLGTGGTVASVRAFGTLNEVIEGTFASEARVRFSAGAGNAFTAFNFQASTVGAYPGTGLGTVAVDRTLNVTPFTLAAGGTMNFEWFESFQDGTAGLPESTWATVTYEFRTASSIQNGGGNLGTLAPNGTPLNVNGSHVAGGLDFFTFTIGTGVSAATDYLNIRMLFTGAAGSMTDTEMAIYDGAGNLLAADDDGEVGFQSQLSYGAGDPNASGGVDEITPGFNGLSLAAGTYTIVTGGFNTTFAPTVNGAHIAGTNAGNYVLCLQYNVPTPGALALVGLGGLVAARRRRA